MPVSPRTSFNSPPLVRVLADLDAAGVADPRHSVAERLGQWVDWTHALPSARALSCGPSDPAPRPDAATAGSPTLIEQFERVRAELARSVANEAAFASEVSRQVDAAGPGRPASTPAAAEEVEVDLPHRRRRHLAHQQAMEARIAPLRADARAALSAKSPELARLAALDAVMDQALAARQRHLLAAVPAMVERHFERLRELQKPAGAEVVGQTLQRVLLAELELRLQPIEGMIDALGEGAANAANTANAENSANAANAASSRATTAPQR